MVTTFMKSDKISVDKISIDKISNDITFDNKNTKNVFVGTVGTYFKLMMCSLLYYLLLHTVFYTLEQIHYNFCTPCGISGYITSLFTSRSSMCKALRTVSWHASDASANVIYAAVSLLGSMLTVHR